MKTETVYYVSWQVVRGNHPKAGWFTPCGMSENRENEINLAGPDGRITLHATHSDAMAVYRGGARQ